LGQRELVREGKGYEGGKGGIYGLGIPAKVKKKPSKGNGHSSKCSGLQGAKELNGM